MLLGAKEVDLSRELAGLEFFNRGVFLLLSFFAGLGCTLRVCSPYPALGCCMPVVERYSTVESYPMAICR